MTNLGIYFSSKSINIAEVAGKKLLRQVQVPYTVLSAGELMEEKVPDDIKMVALLKDELRRNRIEAKETALALPGKDLIIRTFELPVLPTQELESTINFEIRKYIPFKVEELVSDYQVIFDRPSRKNIVLFIALKKEVLERHLSVFKQVGLKVNTIEYSAFSLLRFLNLAGLGRGISGVVCVDLKDKDEASFMVLENGFPLFSWDIALSGTAQDFLPSAEQEQDASKVLEKLKTEIRISLDYYYRKFPAKKIQRTFFVANSEHRTKLEAFAKEIELLPKFIDTTKYLVGQGFSLGLVKSYGSALFKSTKSSLKINLLVSRPKKKAARDTSVPLGITTSLLADLKVDPRIVILGILFCLASFIFGFSRNLSLEKELNKIIGIRPKVATVQPEASYDELGRLASQYRQKLESINNLIKKQLYVTEPLDALPRLLPQGMWLNSFTFRKEEGRNYLTLEGLAFLGDSNKEFNLVNDFIRDLKENGAFAKFFKEVSIVSINTQQSGKENMTNFVISCR